MTKQERDTLNTANLNSYMDSKGIPTEERDVLPFGGKPTNREVIQRAKDHAEWSADNRKGYTEKANVTYAYRTGFFHALNLFKNNDQ